MSDYSVMSLDRNTSNTPPTLSWTGRTVHLLDQTRLPAEETYLEIETVAQLEDAILRLAVRGAPAIGCAGAFGVVLCAREAATKGSGAEWLARFEAACAHLADTRPTAVNLRWAVERCRAVAAKLDALHAQSAEIDAALEREA